MVTSLSILGSAMIAFVAQWGLAGPAALVLYAMVRRWRWRTDGAEAAISGLGTLALVMLSAMAFVHPRPFVQLRTVPLVPHVADNSFPSDHLAACGLAVGFLFIDRVVSVGPPWLSPFCWELPAFSPGCIGRSTS